MAPPFVLLEREVEFVVGGGRTGGASEEAFDIFDRKATEAAVQAMKPDPSVVKPPGVSRLIMVQQMRGVPAGGGYISSTDKALVVLYASHYRPGCCYTPSSGCYLVYDASTNSLSAVPQIPPSPRFTSLGKGAAILSHGSGTYMLAEISTAGWDGEGALYLWQCSSPNQPQGKWQRKLVRLPPQVVVDETNFFVDMAFSYGGSSVCWVDLLQGVLVCDLLKATEEEPELSFIPLPQGYSIDVDMKPRPRPEHFRAMSCVNGVVKFVALVGLYEDNFAGDNILLKSWTLSSDLKEWKLSCNTLALEDLWASKSFCSNFLPEIAPVFPVLSCNEDEVVYLALKEMERKNVYGNYGQLETVETVTKAHHSLRVAIKQNKVLGCEKITQGGLITSFWPTVLSTDFSSYLAPGNTTEGP